MTRINVIPPKDLNSKMLLAEYREIARLPNNLRKSLNRKGKPFSVSEIPTKYTLGTGHVKFFYNRFTFLKKRFILLVEEMLARGYRPNFTDPTIFDVGEPWMGDYEPTDSDKLLNIQRINDRLSKK